MKEYREAYALQDYSKASALLEASDLKGAKKSELLWHLEAGTVAHAIGNEDKAIMHFQASLELIDRLFTTKLGSKAASLLINDSSDEFYGASYERSYAHYYLSQSLYSRYQKRGNKLDLQGARATILAWDTYFTELQRGASASTLYSTDLLLKVFGGQIHEASGIRTDLQIALQLYKDALQVLATQGGIFSVFNRSNTDYIRAFERDGKPTEKLYTPTALNNDLKDFLHYKILTLTKEIRGGEFDVQAKALAPGAEVLKRVRGGPGNVVLVVEEGLIPQKVGKPFNFGIKGAISAVENPGLKAFIATVGTEVVTAFAMNKLGMVPERSADPGSFVFAHSVTRLAVQEAAVEFELPMIEEVPLVQRRELFVLDSKGGVVERKPLPIVSENGDLARVVLEEDVVARYVKTGTRVALRHLLAIAAAYKVYRSVNAASGQGGDFFAKSAAMATYVGASKGIAALEKADTRHWTTLPQALRMSEVKLAPGKYQVGLGTYSGDKGPDAPSRILGAFEVKDSGKTIFTFRLWD